MIEHGFKYFVKRYPNVLSATGRFMKYPQTHDIETNVSRVRGKEKERREGKKETQRRRRRRRFCRPTVVGK